MTYGIKCLLPEKDIVLLREEVMDKQIVDTSGAKVVRVNDLHFLRADSRLRLVFNVIAWVTSIVMIALTLLLIIQVF